MIENNGYLNNSSLYDESIYSIKTAINITRIIANVRLLA